MPGDSETSSALTAAACKWEIMPKLVCCALPETLREKEQHLQRNVINFLLLHPPSQSGIIFYCFSSLSPWEVQIISSDYYLAL